MKNVMAGLVAGCILGATLTAVASTARTAYLNRGDGAVANGSATSCVVKSIAGGPNGFRCSVGGDYRARYGVLINDRRESRVVASDGFMICAKGLTCDECLAKEGAPTSVTARP
jgi:hypothetical protein